MKQVIINYFKDLKQDFKNKKYYKHIPNLLTFIRLISPLFILPAMFNKNYMLTALFVSIAAITDIFDGIIARKYNITTEFGRLLDALTDKVFAMSLLIPIVVKNNVYSIVLINEALIAIVNLIAQKKKQKPKTEYIGKVKTASLFTFLAVCYLALIIPINKMVTDILLIITIVLSLFTLITYILKIVEHKPKAIILICLLLLTGCNSKQIYVDVDGNKIITNNNSIEIIDALGTRTYYTKSGDYTKVTSKDFEALISLDKWHQNRFSEKLIELSNIKYMQYIVNKGFQVTAQMDYITCKTYIDNYKDEFQYNVIEKEENGIYTFKGYNIEENYLSGECSDETIKIYIGK